MYRFRQTLPLHAKGQQSRLVQLTTRVADLQHFTINEMREKYKNIIYMKLKHIEFVRMDFAV